MSQAQPKSDPSVRTRRYRVTNAAGHIITLHCRGSKHLHKRITAEFPQVAQQDYEVERLND